MDCVKTKMTGATLGKPTSIDETTNERERWHLELERQRLVLDRIRHEDETMRTFLERWRTDVQPVHEAKERSREMAYGFAKMAIQTMFLLNGGALIAFPTFAELVGPGLTSQLMFALISIAAFVVGLVFIGVTSLLAYLAMNADAEALSQREEYVKLGLNQSRAEAEEQSKYVSSRAAAEERREYFYQWAVKYRACALSLGIASTVAFMTGAFFAATVMSSASTTSAG